MVENKQEKEGIFFQASTKAASLLMVGGLIYAGLYIVSGLVLGTYQPCNFALLAISGFLAW